MSAAEERRHRELMSFVPALVALLIVAGSLTVTAWGGGAGPRVVASVHLLTTPRSIVVGSDGVWLTTFRSVIRIDPKTNATGPERQLRPILGALAFAGRHLWVARNPIVSGNGAAPVHSQLWSVDSSNGRVHGQPIGFPLIADVAVAKGALWVTNGDHARFGRLFRVDPGRRTITATIKIPGAPSDIALARGVLWVACADTGKLVSVDPQTAAIVGKPVRAGTALLSVSASPRRLWVGDGYDGAVNSVDPRTGRVVTRTNLRYVSGIAVGNGSVWATVSTPSELLRLDPSTGRKLGRPIAIPGTASGVAIGFGSAWVLTGRAVVRVKL